MKNIHVIPTDKPSRLFKDDFDKYFISINIDQEQNHFKPQNIYITNDEEIKEGDWLFANQGANKIVEIKEGNYPYGSINNKGDMIFNSKHWKSKIILTTDQDLIKDGVQAIDDEFLEWFVKNPSCESVEVGYGWIRLTETDNEGYWVSIPDKRFEMQQEEPKQTDENGKTLTYWGGLAEPKQETLEEVADMERVAMDKLKNKWGHLYTFGYPQRPFPTNYENDLNNIKIGLYEGAKWQAERMYSGEEVLNIIVDCDGSLTQAKKWFEQFKKK
jgi:hypothetical protein